MFLGITDFPRCFHQVLLVYVVPVYVMVRYDDVAPCCIWKSSPLVPDGEHPSFGDDVTKVGTVKAIG